MNNITCTGDTVTWNERLFGLMVVECYCCISLRECVHVCQRVDAVIGLGADLRSVLLVPRRAYCGGWGGGSVLGGGGLGCMLGEWGGGLECAMCLTGRGWGVVCVSPAGMMVHPSSGARPGQWRGEFDMCGVVRGGRVWAFGGG
jgi:hypothetical protein